MELYRFEAVPSDDLGVLKFKYRVFCCWLLQRWDVVEEFGIYEGFGINEGFKRLKLRVLVLICFVRKSGKICLLFVGIWITFCLKSEHDERAIIGSVALDDIGRFPWSLLNKLLDDICILFFIIFKLESVIENCIGRSFMISEV